MKIRHIHFWILAADLLWVGGAFCLAIVLRYAGAHDGISLASRFETYWAFTLTTVVAWSFLYFETDLDGFKGGWQLPSILSKAIVAVLLLMMMMLALAFLTRHYYSRLVLLYFALFFTVGFIGIRCFVRWLATSRPRSVADNRCVILGNGPVARELAGKIASHPELPFDVVGFLFPGESEVSNGFASSLGTLLSGIRTLQVLDLLTREKVRKLVIAMPQPNGQEVGKLIAECRKLAIQVYLVPQWYNLYISKAELVELDGLPLLSLQERNPSRPSLALKRVMDVALGGGMLLFVSPVLLSAALFVYGKKRRAFRAELRCSKDGVPFRMYRLNVDRYSITPERYERFLVRWSLTELPQLWNVLRGDMSLVGPRPESAERLNYYSEWQRQRLKVKGGVTGLAQVHGLREQHSSEDKARYDLQYIFSCSPLLDLSLILQTVWTLATRGLRQEPDMVQATNFRAKPNEYATREAIDANRP